jgi:hypothetical protein
LDSKGRVPFPIKTTARKFPFSLTGTVDQHFFIYIFAFVWRKGIGDIGVSSLRLYSSFLDVRKANYPFGRKFLELLDFGP